MNNNIHSKSQIGQDIFVLTQLNNKKDGTFVDIGVGHPTLINNTYVLENDFNWGGISFDIGPPHTWEYKIYDKYKHINISDYKKMWRDDRSTPIICCDALETDYNEVFKEYNLPKNIDYLSMDLEPPMATFECLKLIPFDKYQFKIITFETDYYREKNTQDPSRELLNSYGYKLVKSVRNQEDWYIHSDLNKNKK